MDPASAVSALSAIKSVKDLLSGAIDARVQEDARPLIVEAQRNLSEVYESLFALREETFRLQKANHDLARKVEAAESWSLRIASYALTKTIGGATVYQSYAEPVHFACPRCIETRTVQILQPVASWSHLWKCPACQVEYPVQSELPPKMPFSVARRDSDY